MNRDTAVAKLDRAQVALAECKTAMEAKSIADAAEAARVYLERTNASAETVNRATEIRLLAERQMGEFLKTMPKNEGGDPVPHGNRVGEPPTLREIGISKKQSSRAQKLADIPAIEFRERIESVKHSGARLSTEKVMRAPESPAPPIQRRSPEKFDLATWKRHTATMLDLRFRSVPPGHIPAAIQYVNGFTSRYHTQ